MTAKFDAIFTCCVCGAHLPALANREEYLRKGCAVRLPSGSYLFFCPGRHSPEEIQAMITAVPKFQTGAQIKDRKRSGIL